MDPKQYSSAINYGGASSPGSSKVQAVDDRPERALEAFERRVKSATESVYMATRKIESEADRIHNEGSGGKELLKGMVPGPQSVPGSIPSVSLALTDLEEALERLGVQAGRFDQI